MYQINEIADYVIVRLKNEDSSSLVNLKLQKLMYYIQAWHLAFYDKALFDGKFQAWIHGPVSRELYDRFKDTKSLYSEVELSDIVTKDFEHFDENTKAHIDNILEAYAQFSGYQLEIMTHREEPWIAARKGFDPMERCENEIDENLMTQYYKNRLSSHE